jgi:hypothetical protein
MVLRVLLSVHARLVKLLEFLVIVAYRAGEGRSARVQLGTLCRVALVLLFVDLSHTFKVVMALTQHKQIGGGI